ncbi:MAG: helix-turn-helix domain-containing protein [Armatimonadetes bacterium]|nr:helix-turn-helix domain-containing protein [Armatimonadota bacterium]
MARYDNKLIEWFKKVELREKELKTKKETPQPQPQAVTPPVTQQIWEPPVAQVDNIRQIESVTLEEPVSTASVTAVATAMETKTVLADTIQMDEFNFADFEMTSQPREISAPSGIFEDVEVPQVEDFISFLDNSDKAENAVTDAFPVIETSRNRGIGHLSEGTGEPRPISSDAFIETPPVQEIDKIEAVETTVIPIPEPVRAEVVAPKPKHEAEPKAQSKVRGNSSLQEKWDRMPHHLQTLFGVSAEEEVAQNSYMTFRENRGELIQKLLDPPITLEEAARILNVCPTTVRRYTNRGVLKHFRTAGNQRRFRLSDVLTFMETKGRSSEAS